MVIGETEQLKVRHYTGFLEVIGDLEKISCNTEEGFRPGNDRLDGPSQERIFTTVQKTVCR